MSMIRTSRCFGARVAGYVSLVLAAAGASDVGVLGAEPAHSVDVTEGHALFLREWVPGDPRSHGGDGLGPLYNDSSCVGCHNLGGAGGAGSTSKNVEIISLSRRGAARAKGEDVSVDELHPGFRDAKSVVLHRYGTDQLYRSWRLRRIDGVEHAEMSDVGGEEAMQQIREMVQSNTVPSGRALRPSFRAAIAPKRVKGELLFGSAVSVSKRNPPPLFGVGLIDAIPIEVLLEAQMQSKGRLNLLKAGVVGRFGWKGQTATLKEFVEAACAMELGLEVPSHHQARSPLDFGSKRSAGLDLTQKECDALTKFVGTLPAPTERPDSPDAQAGSDLFQKIGCAECHVPDLGTVRGIYSDLGLHAMGDDLSDASAYYGIIDESKNSGASAEEWRTPPLWGFRDSAPYLHDGRAETLEQAVAFHGGQSEVSAIHFFELPLSDRLKVQTFLNTLSAPTNSH